MRRPTAARAGAAARAGVAAAMAVLAGLIPTVSNPLTASANPAAAGPALRQLSADPCTNRSSQHLTEVEPDTFSHGSVEVAAFQAGRIFDSGASNIG